MYLKMVSDLSRLALWPILMKFYEKTMSEMLNTKTQNIFCCVNENSTTSLTTLNRGTRKQEERDKAEFRKQKEAES